MPFGSKDTYVVRVGIVNGTADNETDRICVRKREMAGFEVNSIIRTSDSMSIDVERMSAFYA